MLDRSVESPAIRKAIEAVYATYLPKNTHPWVYLSLEMDPRNVDVNVHPTKKEVHFMNEEEVIATICEAIQDRLGDANVSRNFLTQSLLPQMSAKSRTEDGSKKPGIHLYRCSANNFTFVAYLYFLALIYFTFWLFTQLQRCMNTIRCERTVELKRWILS